MMPRSRASLTRRYTRCMSFVSMDQAGEFVSDPTAGDRLRGLGYVVHGLDSSSSR
jgi:hypothetical protein